MPDSERCARVASTLSLAPAVLVGTDTSWLPASLPDVSLRWDAFEVLIQIGCLLGAGRGSLRSDGRCADACGTWLCCALQACGGG